MKKNLLAIACLLCVSKGFAQHDSLKIQAAIVGLFNGLSLFDADTMRHYTTADFHLLEDGQVWNIDTLINEVTPLKNKGFIRINKFQFLRTEQQGDMAWVSYHNTAEVSQGDKQRIKNWIESAVLRKEKGKWKIQMLHSTPLQ